MIDFLGGETVAGGKLKSLNLWSAPNVGATNDIDFSALPGGFRGYNNSFSHLGGYIFIWTSSKSLNKPDNAALNYYIENDAITITQGYDDFETGMSVRCIRK